jgi:DNA primase small subunit
LGGSRAQASSQTADKRLKAELFKAPQTIVFAYAYPRLDVEVSKKLNHLLKAPFCVHPKTGKVCVPIRASAADDFDPEAVPTVASLLSELNQSEAGAALGRVRASDVLSRSIGLRIRSLVPLCIRELELEGSKAPLPCGP